MTFHSGFRACSAVAYRSMTWHTRKQLRCRCDAAPGSTIKINLGLVLVLELGASQGITVAADGLPAVNVCSPGEVVLALSRGVDLRHVACKVLDHEAGVPGQRRYVRSKNNDR